MSATQPLTSRVRLSFIGSIDLEQANLLWEKARAALDIKEATARNQGDGFHKDFETPLTDHEINFKLKGAFAGAAELTVLTDKFPVRNAQSEYIRDVAVVSNNVGLNYRDIGHHH